MPIKRIIPRQGTAAAWTSANPILHNGELGYESDTHYTKRGDGVTAWNDLPYGDATTRSWASVFAPPSADDTPTVTMSTSGAISGGTAITPTTDYFGDSHFRYDGCVNVQSLGAGLVSAVQPAVASATYTVIPEFTTSQGCDKVDIKFTLNAAGSSAGVRITVNGRWVTLPLQWFTTTPSAVNYVRLTFPTAKARSIRVELTSVDNFGGVVVPSGETVTRPARDVQKRMVILGDSYTKGANAHTADGDANNGCSQFETFPIYVAKMLGCDSVINLGVGGTGWAVAGSGSPFGTRAADVLAANPHILLAAGSRNDNTSTGPLIYAAALAALSQFADVPSVLVCGIEDSGSGAGTSPAVVNEAVRAAARAVGRPFADMLGVVTAGDKNAADNVHPSILGSQKIAKAFYGALDRPRIDELVASSVGGRASTDLALVASPSAAANVGATVTLTATQSVQRAGTVAFYASGTRLGTATVSAGVATLSTSSLPAGSYILTARFLPSNPLQVKPTTSNVLAYVVDANLGFSDTFTRADGAVGSTENGKPYTTAGSGAFVVSSNKLANPTASANAFCVADAGTPNGTLQVTLNGDSGVPGLGAVIVFRYQDTTNQLALARSSGEIVFNKRVANVTTQVAISTGSSVWVGGDVISVIMGADDTFTVKKNGTNVPGLVGVSCSDFHSVTKHGVQVASLGSAATFDDLSFVAA